MKISHVLGVCALAASVALGAVGSASALIYEQVYTGTVAPGPVGGLFGVSGGEAFTIRFVTDTSRGSGVVNGPNGQAIEGGSDFGASSPMSAFVTINGQTFDFVDSFVVSRSVTSSDPGQPDVSSVASYNGGMDSVEIWAAASGPGAPVTLGSFYSMSTFDTPPLGLFAGRLGDHVFFVTMDMTSAYGGVVGGVPEPASWALMIVGFGGAGGALRASRRRRLVAA